MSIKRKAVSRAGSLAAAVVVALAALVPLVSPFASADTQVQTRSIEMSDSTPSQTNVDYVVTFSVSAGTAGTENSLVLDFCENSSIIGGTCDTSTTTPINASTATLITGTGFTGWTIAAQTATTVKLTKGTGAALPSGAVTFTLHNVTNPAATGTFWARLYTYANTTQGTYSAANSIGNDVEYGGFALSTVPLINISATVMETLTFCINKTTISTTACGGLTPGVSVVLGSGNPKVLSTANGTGSSDTAFFQLSTNALTGAVIKMKTHNTCSGLSRNGGTDGCPIAGIGATASALTTANQALFGVNVAADTAIGSTLGTLTPTAPYNTSSYAMDTTGGNSVLAGGGTKLADTTGAASADLNGVLNFDAEAAATTPAGVYTANESLIATGTF